MAVQVSLNTPLAEALGNVVQPKLSEVGWSTGGLDDSALAEYIILMLVNGKTQEQIAAELSNDLLNLGPDDSGAIDFSRWLFEQVNILSSQLNGVPPAEGLDGQQAQAIPSYTKERRGSHGGNRLYGDSGSMDGGAGEAMEDVQDGGMYAMSLTILFSWLLLTAHCRPTGPKSMRNPSRNGSRRMIGQITKAMDRTSDSVLHRIRPQQGTERINMHNRQPPKGPRGDQARIRGAASAPKAMGIPNGGTPPFAPSNPGHMTPQQQMQIYAMAQEQARVLAEMFSPTHGNFLPGMVPPTMNPAFGHSGQIPQQPSRSLFDRVESRPQRQNGNFNNHHQSNGGQFNASHQQANGNTPVASQSSATGDLSSSMEVEPSQTTHPEPSPDTICKFNLTCTKKDCIYAHQSPAAPPGVTIDVHDHCPFGAACKNRKCAARHPSPSQKVSHQAEQDCRFFPNCTNPACTFRHPTMPMCRNGADCSREGCKFTHIKTLCKFNPCLNPECQYKHADGQKRGAFNDKVWVAENDEEKGHVSDRKFVEDEAGEEELIVPGNQGSGSRASSAGAEVVT